MTHRLAVLAVLAASVTAVHTQVPQLADDQSRREAVQFFRTGQEFFTGERFDRAAEAFTRSTARDPLFTLAHYQLGQSYMNLQRYASAIQAFERCIEASRALFGLALSNRFAVEKQRDDEIREMRESINVMQALASRNPGSGYALRMERAQQHLHDLERQRTSLDSGFRPPAEVLLSLGSAYFRNGNRDEAEFEWKAAAEVNPKLGEVHNNLAVVYMQTGRFSEAEQSIKSAEKTGFRVNPQFKEDLRKRAVEAGRR